jgi:hypothetical protein
MELTRIEFLKACAATAILVNLEAYAWATESLRAAGRKGLKKMALETVTAIDFAEHLDTEFRVFPGEGLPH